MNGVREIFLHRASFVSFVHYWKDMVDVICFGILLHSGGTKVPLSCSCWQ